jgi:hypothetical protein
MNTFRVALHRLLTQHRDILNLKGNINGVDAEVQVEDGSSTNPSSSGSLMKRYLDVMEELKDSKAEVAKLNKLLEEA